LLAGGVGAEGFGCEAGGVEPRRHEAGVLDAHAKPQGAHALGIGELVVELAQDQVYAVVIAGVELRELGGHVTALAPGEGGEVGVVADAEVVEGAEQALVEGGPETQLGGNAAVKPLEDVEPVGALGGGGEAEQQLGGEVIEPAPVAGGGGVVELIHDHHVVGGGVDGGGVLLGKGLHGGKHVTPVAGPFAIHLQFAEGAIAQHLAEGEQGLLQDLLAVGDEQQPGRFGEGELLRKVAVQAGHVEGGEHGFAGAGGGHHKVAEALMQGALGLQLIEHLLLVGVGPQVEPGERRGGADVVVAAGEGELMVEAGLVVGRGGVGLELALFPVGVEVGLELLEHGRRFQCRQTHIPLEAIEQGRTGKVGGADVGGAGATAAMEQPGLGMEPGAAGVGADAHLGTAFDQPVEGLVVGGVHLDDLSTCRVRSIDRHPASDEEAACRSN
jgi:hypothetical protein